MNNIPGIEEVNMMKNDGSVIHFNNPKVQASLAANTFAVTGQSETKQITEMLPGILNQLGAESLQHLKRLATSVGAGAGAGELIECTLFGKDGTRLANMEFLQIEFTKIFWEKAPFLVCGNQICMRISII